MAVFSPNYPLQSAFFPRKSQVPFSNNLNYRCGFLKKSQFRVLACSSVDHKPNIFDKKVEALLDSIKWDDKGLAVGIAQNVDTGAVLMQGFVNRDALAKTISSRKATFYSRSRSQLWTKGETSLNFINVHDIFLDCDRDSIIYLGKPDGPSCHTGAETCYFSSVFNFLEDPQVEKDTLAMTALYSLESTIAERKAETLRQNEGKPSWTKKLLLDEKLLCSKIREEADELCRTLEDNEDQSRAASEMADVLYHSMVLLALKSVKMEDVFQVLRHRFSKSGLEPGGEDDAGENLLIAALTTKTMRRRRDWRTGERRKRSFGPSEGRGHEAGGAGRRDAYWVSEVIMHPRPRPRLLVTYMIKYDQPLSVPNDQ
ncbi:hypothetical protein KSS87_021581 [Heliosperma pusillum]|nr:hypothetical protein KSS87_021581 [Heliosperma pusillum]